MLFVLSMGHRTRISMSFSKCSSPRSCSWASTCTIKLWGFTNLAGILSSPVNKHNKRSKNKAAACFSGARNTLSHGTDHVWVPSKSKSYSSVHMICTGVNNCSFHFFCQINPLAFRTKLSAHILDNSHQLPRLHYARGILRAYKGCQF